MYLYVLNFLFNFRKTLEIVFHFRTQNGPHLQKKRNEIRDKKRRVILRSIAKREKVILFHFFFFFATTLPFFSLLEERGNDTTPEAKNTVIKTKQQDTNYLAQ